MRPPPPTPKHVCRVLRGDEYYLMVQTKITGEEAVWSPPPAFPCPFGSADVDNMAAQPLDNQAEHKGQFAAQDRLGRA